MPSYKDNSAVFNFVRFVYNLFVIDIWQHDFMSLLILYNAPLICSTKILYVCCSLNLKSVMKKFILNMLA